MKQEKNKTKRFSLTGTTNEGEIKRFQRDESLDSLRKKAGKNQDKNI